MVQEDTTDVQVILPYMYVELHAHCYCCSLMQQRERFDWREVPLTMKGVCCEVASVTESGENWESSLLTR